MKMERISGRCQGSGWKRAWTSNWTEGLKLLLLLKLMESQKSMKRSLLPGRLGFKAFTLFEQMPY
jgi:hypothetical protein